MTVDVEDYYQVSAFLKNVATSDWDKMESRVVRNTELILEMFDNFSIKATFFTLGWVAERESNLVRSILKEGHEIACHGYSHKLIYNQSPDIFREETLRAKNILEDITGTEIYGYRAASYSITRESKWALDILSEVGFKYDSSIFPVHHDRYGMPGTSRQPHIMETSNGRSIVEFPLSTMKLFGCILPVAGGGYFRLYPYWFTRFALNSINKVGKPFVFYFHPWEIDPKQPRIETNALSKFRHYNNLDRCQNRLEKLLSDFRFSTMKNILQEEKLLMTI